MIQKAIETTRASLDPPKTLLELQTPPTQNVLGYEVHHIVEQNDDNIAKSPLEAFIEKFGRNLIDSRAIWSGFRASSTNILQGFTTAKSSAMDLYAGRSSMPAISRLSVKPDWKRLEDLEC
jgi:hypothetical protein